MQAWINSPRSEVKKLMNGDFYRTLGLSPDSSAGEIKKAYRNLAMQYHPDRNRSNPESEERLKEINEAYEILGDAEKRRRYDLLHQQRLNGHLFHGRDMDDDFFTVLRKFSQRDFTMKRRGGCMRRGFGKRGCGRWKTER